MAPPPRGFRTILGRCLRRRCPACGRGRIFAGPLRLRRSCDACEWILERDPGAVTGAMYVVAILTQLFAAALLLAIWLLTDWKPVTIVAVGVPILVVVSAIALPVSRAIWVAVDYWTDQHSDAAAAPGYRDRAYDRNR